jgi:hypothetical protein
VANIRRLKIETRVSKTIRTTAIPHPTQNDVSEQPALIVEARETRPGLFVVTPIVKAHWEIAIVTMEYVDRPIPIMTVVMKRKTNWTLPYTGPRILEDQM